MEIKIIENTKTRVLFELMGEDHTFCNILVKQLQGNKDVKYAAYSIEHPLAGVPKILVEGKDVKSAIKKAVEELLEQAEELKKIAASI